ncbi:MAG: preprotein translocase subunit SecE [Clostridia bacterium]|jgi:preprotein translocase subunit SecE|nr:preprotein translocase, SecE subunit [Clostridiales bacterium]MDK2986143.1 preprotein translocase subunit SecE [Clostridia bacterium]
MAKAVSKSKDKKGNQKLTEKVSRFFRGVWYELKKVHWPNRKELVTYVSVVLVSVLIVSALIWIVDSIFSFLLDLVI